jgi:hypothetical protein
MGPGAIMLTNDDMKEICCTCQNLFSIAYTPRQVLNATVSLNNFWCELDAKPIPE